MIRGTPLPLDRPRVMGILNVTPDSFSDGGSLPSAAAAIERGLAMVEQGADLIDVGGESTRPGALSVPAAVQLDRVLPVIEGLMGQGRVPLSVDTRCATVARQALAAGASVVNDVSALSDPQMAAEVRGAGAGLVLMHMRGTPETMQSLATYQNVVEEVRDELLYSLDGARRAGIDERCVVLDPGIGFAKTTEHNLALLGALHRFASLGRPLLVGPSRKQFLGEVLGGAPPRERVAGTVAACVAAWIGGARLFRAHDVAPVRQALDVAAAIHPVGPASR
jgi:dihydropteroate synthase